MRRARAEPAGVFGPAHGPQSGFERERDLRLCSVAQAGFMGVGHQLQSAAAVVVQKAEVSGPLKALGQDVLQQQPQEVRPR